MAKFRKLPPASTRVTMRALAESAGVSVQAVSLALRNHPSISSETRGRIQALAKRWGYAPDPHLVKLMHHLRATHKRKTTPTVCFITTRPPNEKEGFCDLLLEGASEAARLAGFSFHVAHVDPDKASGNHLQRTLRSRGVEGLLLLPMADLRSLDALVDWQEFSVVSATLSVTSPQFDRVVADHFFNMFGLCGRLQAAGYRRPGLVIYAEHDKRCGYHPTAALAWHGVYGGIEPTRAHRYERLEQAALRRWLEVEAPDILLPAHDELACELRKQSAVTGKLPIVSCSARPSPDGSFPFSGNYDNPREIGAVAVETLARKIALGQRGVPDNPHTTLIRGAWVNGPGIPPRR